MNDKAKVIEKVRKLLALAADTAANENEAALAMMRVQVILADHNLSISDVETNAEQSQFTVDQDTLTPSQPWQRGLGVGVAQLYFCEHFFTFHYDKTATRQCGYKRYDRHCFVGEPHNIAVAKLMFDYLVKTVERLARDGAKTVPVRERSRYMTTFRSACSGRLQSRIFKMIAHVETKTGGENSRNLPALYETNRQLLETWMHTNIGGLRETTSRDTVSHAQARNDGLEAGDSISLSAQIEGGLAGSHLIEKG